MDIRASHRSNCSFSSCCRAVSGEFSLSTRANPCLQFIVHTEPTLQIQSKLKQSTGSQRFTWSSGCLMVALLQIKLQAAASILMALSFTFARHRTLVNANAASVMRS